ncbi:DUF983 domain-containing protein [Maritalea porphyrae]|uniref:DUF983 domain-containing protein n=1 Tax=Maritalea porphyrae TaxID=880732 RepID=A0ABQ5UVP5_9HYPH|nr:DUF983 domain-containing protein [Maritalea porphyrae]GLQ18623.1 hypothetical protein GCM10007879_28720 [Maritalea porphyrae]
MSIEINAIDKPKRSVWAAMKNGIVGKCPKCGKGKLFKGYLRVNSGCSSCGEAFHHHRADDAPPYITMAIVGHVVVGGIFHLETSYQIEPMVHLYWSIPTMLVLSLGLLRPIKGMIVAIQWANYLHGFDPNFSPATDMQ